MRCIIEITALPSSGCVLRPDEGMEHCWLVGILLQEHRSWKNFSLIPLFILLYEYMTAIRRYSSRH